MIDMISLKKITFIFIFFIGVSTGYIWANESPGLPVIHIIVPESPFVYRELWQSGSISITDIFNEEPVSIRGRGNSTWLFGEQKRPLRFRLETPQKLFGSTYAHRDWILLANLFDHSLMRNHAAFHLAASMNMSFAPSSTFVHLYVNGEYMGVYQVTDERSVSPGRVDIERHEIPELSGFFLEINSTADEDGILNETFVEVNRKLYDIRFPAGQALTPEHAAYVAGYIKEINRLIRERDFDTLSTLIDIPSFVDFYIIQEFLKDADGYERSIFMYISGVGENRRLRKGPVWDFDGAAASDVLTELDMFYIAPEGLYIAIFQEWYRFLILIPEFYELTADRWREVSRYILPNTLENMYEISRIYRADFIRNFDRHPIPRRGTAQEAFDTGQEDFINWLMARAAWLDDFFSSETIPADFWQPAYRYFSNPEQKVGLIMESEYIALDFPVIILNSTSLLPLSEIERIFGLTAINEENRVSAYNGSEVVFSHTYGATFFEINGEYHDILVPPDAFGELFLPVRHIAEALGFEVDWEPENRNTVIF